MVLAAASSSRTVSLSPMRFEYKDYILTDDLGAGEEDLYD